MKVQTRNLTPDAAKKLLATNSMNRKLLDTHIDFLAKAIRDGHWQLNGEAIKVSTDNTLLDGQHRCAAVIRANKPIRTVFVTDLPTQVFKSMDTGKKRNASDLLSINKVENASLVASVIRIMVAYCSSVEMKSARAADMMQNSEVLALYVKNSQGNDRIQRATRVGWRMSKVGVPSTAAAFYYLISSFMPAEADAFFESLITGADLSRGDPVLVLRDKFLQHKYNRSISLTRPGQWHLYARAWNMHRKNEAGVKALRVMEKMPDIYGVNRSQFIEDFLG